MPVSGKATSDESNFPLEPILSNTSYSEEPNKSWTYFILDIPRGAAGGNIRIRLSSDIKITSEVYARFGGYPSLDSWDYYFANKTGNSDGSMFFKLYNSSEEKVDLYILSIKEGTWCFGIRHTNGSDIASRDSSHQTIMSISLERCPKRCSSHGQCKFALDASGLALYRLSSLLYFFCGPIELVDLVYYVLRYVIFIPDCLFNESSLRHCEIIIKKSYFSSSATVPVIEIMEALIVVLKLYRIKVYVVLVLTYSPFHNLFFLLV